MTDVPQTDLTPLLRAAQQGTEGRTALLEATYAHLRRIAGALMRRERPGHTLQPTELVHNAWFKLVDQTQVATKPSASTATARTTAGSSASRNRS